MYPFPISDAHDFIMKALPRGADSKEPILHKCTAPSQTVIVDFTENCLVCVWDSLLPVSVGNVMEFNSLDEVWNSPIAKLIQQDIADKKFTWCAVEHCGIRKHDNVRSYAILYINIDESCNLHCPSCRRNPIMHTSGPEVERKQLVVERIMAWLDAYTDPIEVIISGNGDALASQILRPLFKGFVPKHKQTLTLFTNGLLIKKQLNNNPVLKSIGKIMISVDAASPDTYHKIRLGGNWDVLQESFEFLKEQGLASITTLFFIVQRTNYREVPAFIDMCHNFGFKANITQLEDWGTWVNQETPTPDAWTQVHGTFMDHNVLDSKHPEFEQCKELLVRVIKNNPSNTTFTQRIKWLVGLTG